MEAEANVLQEQDKSQKVDLEKAIEGLTGLKDETGSKLVAFVEETDFANLSREGELSPETRTKLAAETAGDLIRLCAGTMEKADTSVLALKSAIVTVYIENHKADTRVHVSERLPVTVPEMLVLELVESSRKASPLFGAMVKSFENTMEASFRGPDAAGSIAGIGMASLVAESAAVQLQGTKSHIEALTDPSDLQLNSGSRRGYEEKVPVLERQLALAKALKK